MLQFMAVIETYQNKDGPSLTLIQRIWSWEKKTRQWILESATFARNRAEWDIHFDSKPCSWSIAHVQG